MAEAINRADSVRRNPISQSPNLLRALEQHLRSTGVSPSRFGREIAADPRLIHDIRRGRQPRPQMEARIRAAIAEASNASA